MIHLKPSLNLFHSWLFRNNNLWNINQTLCLNVILFLSIQNDCCKTMSVAVQPHQLVITLSKSTLDLLCIKCLTVYLPLSTSCGETIVIPINRAIYLITVSIGNVYFLSMLCFLRHLHPILLCRTRFVSVTDEDLKIHIKTKKTNNRCNRG